MAGGGEGRCENSRVGAGRAGAAYGGAGRTVMGRGVI